MTVGSRAARSTASESPASRESHSTDALETAVRRAYRLPLMALAAAVVVLIGVVLLSATTGAAGLPPVDVLGSLFAKIPGIGIHSPLSDQQEAVLWSIRLPRTVLGLMVGGGLAMAGAAYQGTFRNPLADPYLLGVSAGAGLGAVLAIGFGLKIAGNAFAPVPAAAFLGALVAVGASALVARGSFGSPATLLLAGVAVAAFFSAAQTFALQRLDPTRSREVLAWMFGSLNSNGWGPVAGLLPYMVIAAVVLVAHGRHLDVLRVGDDEARTLGLHPGRTRLIVLTAATLLTAAAVSTSGLIAFVGLVVPHLVRLLASHSYRVIVPLSGVVGAAFLGLVDVGARTLAAPAELPVGVITAFVGAPFFGLLLWRTGGGRP